MEASPPTLQVIHPLETLLPILLLQLIAKCRDSNTIARTLYIDRIEESQSYRKV